MKKVKKIKCLDPLCFCCNPNSSMFCGACILKMSLGKKLV